MTHQQDQEFFDSMGRWRENIQKQLPAPSGEYEAGMHIADCASVTVRDWYTRLGHFRQVANLPIEFVGENPIVPVGPHGRWPWEEEKT